MKLSSKIELHSLTLILFFIGFLTGYFKYMIAIFAIVLIHEFGHVFLARLFNREVEKIVLLPFGGLSKMKGLVSEDIFEDLLIAVGGVFFQVLLGGVIVFLYDKGYLSHHAYQFLASYNKMIIGFNLLPICPLDGYKICKLIGELFIPYKMAYVIAALVSLFTLGITLACNFEIFMNNPLVLFFLIFTLGKEVYIKKFVMAKFLMERVNYDFFYIRKDVPNVDKMFKNRTNYIRNVHERDYLMHYFTKKGN